MRLRSDFRDALANMHRLHRESGEERPEQFTFHQYQRWHSSSSSSSTSWWHWNQNWWSSYFLFFCCSRIVYSWCQSARFFSCLRACVIICHTTLAQVFVRVIPSMCHAPECLISLRPSLRTLHFVSPIFHFILLNFDFYLFLVHVDVARARFPVHFAQ